jgi:putative glutamine amidotransferase
LNPLQANPLPPPKIAIPIPKSDDPDYCGRALPQYETAVSQAGGEPVRIALDLPPGHVQQLIAGCDGILLPGSGADVDPANYGAESNPHTAPADPKRHAMDMLMLEHAYSARKPVLAICYGLQSLNVYRNGTLIQHIPDFLPADKKTLVNHEAGRQVEYAHRILIDPQSELNRIAGATEIAANSSHHQSADGIGDGLRVVARCKEDGIVEALEGTSPEHFVLAVQWHPERTTDDAPSRAIFASLVEAARSKHSQAHSVLEQV